MLNYFRYQVEISFTGLPNVCRVGFLGHNAAVHKVEYFLEILEESLNYIRKNELFDPSSALEKYSILDSLKPQNDE